jgi:hypothetical protein
LLAAREKRGKGREKRENVSNKTHLVKWARFSEAK